MRLAGKVALITGAAPNAEATGFPGVDTAPAVSCSRSFAPCTQSDVSSAGAHD